MKRTRTRSFSTLACVAMVIGLIVTPVYAGGKGPKEDKKADKAQEQGSEGKAPKEDKKADKAEEPKAPKENKNTGKAGEQQAEEPKAQKAEETKKEPTQTSSGSSTQSPTSSAKKPESTGGGGSKGGGAKGGCIGFYFLYTDGHVDSADCWTGGMEVRKTEMPTLHVNSLHVSCSDTFHPDGTAESSDLAGHLVADWWINRSGKLCGNPPTEPPPPPTCPDGTTMVDGQCVPPPTCPEGTTMVDGQCVPPTTCPDGTTMVNGHCVPPTTCPDGTTMVNGKCVPPTTCPEGTDMVDGECLGPEVLGKILTRGSTAPPQQVGGSVLPFTGGSGIPALIVLALGLLATGTLALRVRRRTN